MRDGEIVTACQAACPAERSYSATSATERARLPGSKQSQLNYSLLAELNTLPRTTYLARIRNPHPGTGRPATNDTPPVEPTELDRFEGGQP